MYIVSSPWDEVPIFRSELRQFGLKKKDSVAKALFLEQTAIANESRYRTRNIPAAGALLKEEDGEEKQITMDL